MRELWGPFPLGQSSDVGNVENQVESASLELTLDHGTSTPTISAKVIQLFQDSELCLGSGSVRVEGDDCVSLPVEVDERDRRLQRRLAVPDHGARRVGGDAGARFNSDFCFCKSFGLKIRRALA